MSKNDCGPAWPVIETEPLEVGCDGNYTTIGNTYSHGGVSVRDYFAAKAMQAAVSTGELPSDWIGFNENGDWAGLAKHAYAIADAMLAERAKDSP